jgi:hypothetical protein
MQRGRLHLFLIPIAALIPALPLILHGCSCGHDFDFHILSWFEAARQFAHGNLHPQWAITAAYDAGEPRFVFYPPISWTLGAILGLLMPWTWAPIAYTWIVLTAAGFGLHHLARHFATPSAALLAAVFYIVNPYMLFTAYERTAYAELLAAIWIPLLLLAILRDHVTIPRVAVPVALLWLTNAPAAVMSCYALALLTTVRLATTPRTNKSAATTSRTTTNRGAPSSRRLLPLRWASHERATAPAHPQTRTNLALNTAAGTFLGLGLAATYLVPAAYERRYIQIAEALTPGFRIQDNFLFHHTTAGLTDPTALSDALLHDQVLHTASTIALILIILTTLTLITAAIRKPQPTTNNQQPATSLIILAAAITLLLTPISAPIWRHAPELLFLQFPWRFLAILAAALSLTVAIALSKVRLKPTATTAIALTIAAALTYPAYKVFRQDCDPEDTVAARLALFHANLGSDASDEYTPINAHNDALAHTDPPYWCATNPKAPAPPNTQPGPAPSHFTFKATQPGFLILNLRDYPSWNITTTDSASMSLDHPSHIHRDDGLIALPLYHPADYTIDATYTTPRDKTIGAILTILALIILSILLFRDRTRA